MDIPTLIYPTYFSPDYDTAIVQFSGNEVKFEEILQVF
jgi:hypothetical protein